MSSPRPVAPSDALIVRPALPAAPLRMPQIDQTDFVLQFNQIYAAIGMQLQPLPHSGGDGSPPRNVIVQSAPAPGDDRRPNRSE